MVGFHTTGPTQAELDLWGIRREDLGPAQVVEVWPESWNAMRLFEALDTQWRHGFNGPTGIDYSAIPVMVEWLGLSDVDKVELFAQIRLMEREAQTHIAKAHNSA